MWGGKQVLIVGDSHPAGAPGRALAALLEARGATVERWAEVGWGPSDWLSRRGDELETRLAQGRSDLVLWWFGTNDPASQAAPAIETFSQLAPGSWFIGPPSYSDPARAAMAAELVAVERRAFGLHFIDARPLSVDLPRGADGIHFTEAGGEPWARRILRAIEIRRWARPLVFAGGATLGGLLGATLAGAFR